MDRLRPLRMQAGYTQQQMADHLGLERSTYTKYETGASEPSLATLRRLARTFDVTLDYLLGQSDDPVAPSPLDALAFEGVDINALTMGERAELADFARFLLTRHAGKP